LSEKRLCLIILSLLVQTVDNDTGEVLFPVQCLGEHLSQGVDMEGGLSSFHISPQPSINFYSGASLLSASRGADKIPFPHEVHRRGLASFSPNSRRRLMRQLAKVRRDNVPLFATLTYPGVWPEDPGEWKRHLDNFIKRLGRQFPNVSGVWKMEPQKRGAPHFHLFVWGCEYAHLISWVSRAWFEVVGSGDPRHIQAGTRVEKIRSVQGAFSYASKYFTKIVAAWGNVGRWWGVFFRSRLPLGEVVAIVTTKQKAIEFIRYMRRFARLRSRDYKSLTVICHADRWVNQLL
jgi:hypothetical protein